MSFANWLLMQDDRDDPVGDLARDFRRDRSMDPDAERITMALQLRRRLEARGVSQDVLDAHRTAAREWAAWDRGWRR